MTLLLKCSSFVRQFVNNHSILPKFVLFIPFVMLLSCSKIDVDQTDPKVVTKLYLSSIDAHKYEAAYALLEPNKQVSLQEFTKGHKKLSEFVGENPEKLPDDTSMEVNIEGDKATVKARSIFKHSNGSQSEMTNTVGLVQIEGKWWVSSSSPEEKAEQEEAEQEGYTCSDKDGNISYSEQPCPAEYTAHAVEIPVKFKDYCTAIFKRDYSYKDKYSGRKVDVKKGEKLLLSSKSSKDSFMPTNFAYLTDQGAVIFPNNEEEDDSKLFSSNCDSKQTKSVFVAFTDAILYTDKNLDKQQACQLSSGVVIDASEYRAPSATFTSDLLAPLCNGRKTVYPASVTKNTNLGNAFPFWLLLAPQ